MDTSSTITPVNTRKKMPAEVFVRMLYGSTETGWDEVVKFGNHPSGERQVTFLGIEVEEDVIIYSDIFHFVLSNCSLLNCKFKNYRVRSITITEHSSVGEILIDKATIGNFSIWENSSAKNFVIGNEARIEGFSIQESTTGFFEIENSSIGNISVYKNSTIGYFSIKSDSKFGDFYIENSTIGYLIVENSKICNFNIKDSKAGNINLKSSETKNFRIRQKTTIGNIEITENSTTGRLSFTEKSSIGNFLSENSMTTSLFVENSKMAQIRIWHSELRRIQVKSQSFISQIQCQFNLHVPVHIVLENSDFGHLNFENSVSPEFTTFNISECKVNRLTLNNFCNYGTIFFGNVQPLETWNDFKKDENGVPIFEGELYQFEDIIRSSIIRLTDSDLGKMQFINCDLREFDRFEFSNTKMLDVFIAGSNMPNDKKFCLPNNEKDALKEAHQKRLAYGQFKKIYEAQGDMPNSLQYLAFEMNAYRKELGLRSKNWFSFFGEKIMLFFNGISTNYGNNWGQGALVTIAVAFLCFANYLRLIGYECGEWNKSNMDLFWDLFSYAPQYLNPLRDADSVLPDILLPIYIDGKALTTNKNGEIILPPWARFWDYSSRIFVAYFAYQTIQAFRKLGKSSG